MTVKASGRSALIFATGLIVCFAAGPSQATTGANSAAANATSENAEGASVAPNKYARHGSRHGKGYAHHKSSKVAEKSAAGNKAADAADNGDNSPVSFSMPPSIANANAQLASADTPTGNAARAMSARASQILQNAPDSSADARPAETTVVAADQLNDVDRALHESPLAVASADAPAAPPAAPVMAAGSGESSTWDETSLIGKIFIGFGALLTMASAARMFMA
jgi:hypothetical protein